MEMGTQGANLEGNFLVLLVLDTLCSPCPRLWRRSFPPAYAFLPPTALGCRAHMGWPLALGPSVPSAHTD